MSNYVESKKELDKIRNEFGCKGDILFRTAIQYVVDCGRQCFDDEEWVKEQLDIVDKKHDAFDRDKKTPFISRDFEKAIIECAQEISRVNSYDLLVYIQKEVWLSNEGIDYQRAIELLKSCLEWFTDDTNSETIIENLNLLGFNDYEIEELGYGWLFEEEEE